MTFRYWVANGHFFVNDSCSHLPPSFETPSTVGGEDRDIQDKQRIDWSEQRHPKYIRNLLCMNLAVLDERDWSSPLRIRCPDCKDDYAITRDMYEAEKGKVPKIKRRSRGH